MISSRTPATRWARRSTARKEMTRSRLTTRGQAAARPLAPWNGTVSGSDGFAIFLEIFEHGAKEAGFEAGAFEVALGDPTPAGGDEDLGFDQGFHGGLKLLAGEFVFHLYDFFNDEDH